MPDPEIIEDTFTIGDSPKLIVENESGDVTVESGPDGTIEVQAGLEHAERLDYDVRLEGGTIRVVAKKKKTGALSNVFGRGGRADISVIVPRSTKTELKTVAGDVELRGVESSGKLSTVNGKVLLYDVEGSYEGSTVNGKVTMDNVKGRFRGSAVNGAIAFSGELAPGGENELTTVNGSVTATLEGSTKVVVEASALNGSYTSEMSAREGDSTDVEEATLTITTVNGSVTVR